jgi:hypothetical protein
MLRATKKENLPQKICVVCLRQFNWRKKWKKVWDKVKYCSDNCSRKKLRDSISKQAAFLTYLGILPYPRSVEFYYFNESEV